MKKRKLLFTLICLLLVFGCCLVSCKKDPDTPGETKKPEESTTDNGGDPENPGGDETKELTETVYSLAQVTDNLRISGRHTVIPAGITCDHAASGIEFNAYCKGDVRLKLESNGETYFSVWIDGIRKSNRIHAADGESTVTIARYLAEGEHSIRILKQTDSRLSRTVLKELDLTGRLEAPPAERPLYIEFIGDSITSGYGNLTSGKPTDVGSSLYEDATQSFAFLAAEALNADCSLVSCAGIGVVQGYVDFNISDFYPCTSYYRDRSVKFTAGRIPDVVVINLGTNDLSKKADAQEFSAGVKALTDSVHSLYGDDVPIVWAYNMMNEGNSTLVRSLFRTLGGEAAGYFSVALGRDTAGGNSHPSLEGHKTSAGILAGYLKDKGFADGTWKQRIEVLPALVGEKEGKGWSLTWEDGFSKENN